MLANGARTRSDILYQIRPSFLEGMARAFDLFGDHARAPMFRFIARCERRRYLWRLDDDRG